MIRRTCLRPVARAAALLVLTPLLFGALCYAKWELCECRLVTITPGALYQSATIPADELPAVLDANGIKTVIDLRDHRQDLIAAERAALARSGHGYVHLPMPQVVDRSHAAQFLAALARAERPVLVHCHHGQGRSVMMCAVHRIENEGWTNAGAFDGTARLPDRLRFLTALWPGLRRFRADTFKGRFVLEYERGDQVASAR